MQKKIGAGILWILGIFMLYLGWHIQGLPPAVTGAGFLVIGYLFFRDK